MAKTLIAFFSRADENYFGGAMRYVKVGNTEIVAGIIKDLIPADSFKIEMKNPYSPVYMTCIEEAKKDLRAKARPALVSVPESIVHLPGELRFLRQDHPSALHQRGKRHGLERARDQEDLPRRRCQEGPAHHRQHGRKL